MRYLRALFLIDQSARYKLSVVKTGANCCFTEIEHGNFKYIVFVLYQMSYIGQR